MTWARASTNAARLVAVVRYREERVSLDGARGPVGAGIRDEELSMSKVVEFEQVAQEEIQANLREVFRGAIRARLKMVVEEMRVLETAGGRHGYRVPCVSGGQFFAAEAAMSEPVAMRGFL